MKGELKKLKKKVYFDFSTAYMGLTLTENLFTKNRLLTSRDLFLVLTASHVNFRLFYSEFFLNLRSTIRLLIDLPLFFKKENFFKNEQKIKLNFYPRPRRFFFMRKWTPLKGNNRVLYSKLRMAKLFRTRPISFPKNHNPYNLHRFFVSYDKFLYKRSFNLIGPYYRNKRKRIFIPIFQLPKVSINSKYRKQKVRKGTSETETFKSKFKNIFIKNFSFRKNLSLLTKSLLLGSPYPLLGDLEESSTEWHKFHSTLFRTFHKRSSFRKKLFRKKLKEIRRHKQLSFMTSFRFPKSSIKANIPFFKRILRVYRKRYRSVGPLDQRKLLTRLPVAGGYRVRSRLRLLPDRLKDRYFMKIGFRTSNNKFFSINKVIQPRRSPIKKRLRHSIKDIKRGFRYKYLRSIKRIIRRYFKRRFFLNRYKKTRIKKRKLRRWRLGPIKSKKKMSRLMWKWRFKPELVKLKLVKKRYYLKARFLAYKRLQSVRYLFRSATYYLKLHRRFQRKRFKKRIVGNRRFSKFRSRKVRHFFNKLNIFNMRRRSKISKRKLSWPVDNNLIDRAYPFNEEEERNPACRNYVGLKKAFFYNVYSRRRPRRRVFKKRILFKTPLMGSDANYYPYQPQSIFLKKSAFSRKAQLKPLNQRNYPLIKQPFRLNRYTACFFKKNFSKQLKLKLHYYLAKKSKTNFRLTLKCFNKSRQFTRKKLRSKFTKFLKFVSFRVNLLKTLNPYIRYLMMNIQSKFFKYRPRVSEAVIKPVRQLGLRPHPFFTKKFRKLRRRRRRSFQRFFKRCYRTIRVMRKLRRNKRVMRKKPDYKNKIRKGNIKTRFRLSFNFKKAGKTFKPYSRRKFKRKYLLPVKGLLAKVVPNIKYLYRTILQKASKLYFNPNKVNDTPTRLFNNLTYLLTTVSKVTTPLGRVFAPTKPLTLKTRHGRGFILTTTGFLFLKRDTTRKLLRVVRNSSMLVSRIKKNHFSFLYKDDIKRLYLKRPGFHKFLSIFPRKRRFKRLRTFRFNLTRHPHGLGQLHHTPKPSSSIFESFYRDSVAFRRTYTRNFRVSHRFREPNCARIKRIRFKPGYQRIWRRARASFNYNMGFNFRYQAKLTKRITNLRRIRTDYIYRFLEMCLSKIILNSRFVFDIATSKDLILNGLVFVNGLNTLNEKMYIYSSDFIQLFVTLKFYISYKWLYSWKRYNRIKYFKFLNFKNNASRRDLSKQVSYHLPDWIFNRYYRNLDIPKFIELDFFTLSFFVIYDLTHPSEYNPTTLMEPRTGIYTMYNWKYIN